jgi:hypothetical protein
LFGLGKEKLSGVLKNKDKIPPHSFGQRGAKCTPKIVPFQKFLEKFILSLVPTGGDEMDTLFLRKFFTPSLV